MTEKQVDRSYHLECCLLCRDVYPCNLLPWYQLATVVMATYNFFDYSHFTHNVNDTVEVIGVTDYRDPQQAAARRQCFSIYRIMKRCPCNVYPLETHFYIAKLGYPGVYLFFLFLLQNIDCGYSLEPPRRGGSNVYPQSMF